MNKEMKERKLRLTLSWFKARRQMSPNLAKTIETLGKKGKGRRNKRILVIMKKASRRIMPMKIRKRRGIKQKKVVEIISTKQKIGVIAS